MARTRRQTTKGSYGLTVDHVDLVLLIDARTHQVQIDGVDVISIRKIQIELDCAEWLNLKLAVIGRHTHDATPRQQHEREQR